jgi:hypothetical protein
VGNKNQSGSAIIQEIKKEITSLLKDFLLKINEAKRTK